MEISIADRAEILPSSHSPKAEATPAVTKNAAMLTASVKAESSPDLTRRWHRSTSTTLIVRHTTLRRLSGRCRRPCWPPPGAVSPRRAIGRMPWPTGWQTKPAGLPTPTKNPTQCGTANRLATAFYPRGHVICLGRPAPGLDLHGRAASCRAPLLAGLLPGPRGNRRFPC